MQTNFIVYIHTIGNVLLASAPLADDREANFGLQRRH